jgi:DNA-3-methyladenine glycosylase II
MPRNPHTTALRRLAAADPILAAALTTCGLPPPRNREPGFASLARIIVGQQVSTASAVALWTRLTAGIAPFTPEAVVRCNEEQLRALGLSRQKAAYTLGLAREIVEGRLDLERLHTLDDEAAILEITRIKGLGRWSAEVYLLFALQRPDIWPAGDLALQVGMQHLRGLRKRPDPKRMIKLAETWRPYRGAAAHFLWHYYAKAPFRAGER